MFIALTYRICECDLAPTHTHICANIVIHVRPGLLCQSMCFSLEMKHCPQPPTLTLLCVVCAHSLDSSCSQPHIRSTLVALILSFPSFLHAGTSRDFGCALVSEVCKGMSRSGANTPCAVHVCPIWIEPQLCVSAHT